MQATWSQPVAEAVVFSNNFASRRERPLPWSAWAVTVWRSNAACSRRVTVRLR